MCQHAGVSQSAISKTNITLPCSREREVQMRVLLLSPLDSSHTSKWAESLAKRNVKVCVVGLDEVYDAKLYAQSSNIVVRSLGINASTMTKHAGNMTKLFYLTKLPSLMQEIRLFKPDIVHAHFASSNGLLGSLSNFHPLIVSVWGSDVFDFPEISPFHRALIRFNLSRADRVLSTSLMMARQTNRFTKKPVEVTPFGVDIDQFSSMPRPIHPGIVVGTVKRLEPKYGIDYLLRAFKVLSDRNPQLALSLLVVGEGSQRKQLEALAVSLGVRGKVSFMGHVPYCDIARCHKMIDVFVFPSISDSESFGVAAVEASACGNPVVASNIGGLPEVVEHGVTGFIVPPREPVKIADAIEKLILDSGLRTRMGSAGRRRVENLFNWNHNVSQMIEIYKSTLHGARGSPVEHIRLAS
jgi:glycosyltransferase involved in cell wall biosynthesis